MKRFPPSWKAILRWAAILLPLAVVIGSTSAFFLWALDAVTRIRFAHPGLLFLLPIGGLCVGVVYERFGKSAVRGNNLLIDEIHQPGAGVPRRMAPLVFVGTLVTHLFGGSAGREGTAVQMGGSIAAAFARILRLDVAGVRILLMAGVAAGFGSVFGTPLAGAVFAVEVLVVGRMRHEALVPCLLASVMADWTCRAWGVAHTHYPVETILRGILPDPWMMLKIIPASAVLGLAALLFSTLSHRLAGIFETHVPRSALRPFIGGLLVIGLFFLVGTGDYLGLGVLGNRPDALTLPALFTSTDVSPGAWAWKLLFTVVTLGSGFKGGEVTPLFFIGAALGNTLATALGAPVDLFAAVGFVAIFAGATNTPFASILLGMELFGPGNLIYIATACLIACACSGPGGIYPAQRTPAPR